MATSFSTSSLLSGAPANAQFNSNAQEARGNVAPDPLAGETWKGLFWDKADLTDAEATRWSKSYPYQLLVLKRTSAGGKVSYLRDDRWKYTLPLNPEALTVSMPFAITTIVTLGGIVEQHGGAPLRHLQIQGSFGVAPARNSAAVAQSTIPFAANTIEAGTIAIQSVRSTLGNPPAPKNLYETGIGDQGSKDLQHGTGYYQYRMLVRFLESYAEMKRADPDARDLRLAFAIWKEQGVYLVTPAEFTLRRSAQSPLEYTYSLSMKAWKRIDPSSLSDQDVAFTSGPSDARDPNVLNQVLNKIGEVRNTISKLQNVVTSAQADVDGALEVCRQATLTAKDALGVGLALIDFPRAIMRDVRVIVLDSWDSLKQTVQAYGDLNGWSSQLSDDYSALDQAAGDKHNRTSWAAADEDIWDNPSVHHEILSVLEVPVTRLPIATQAKVQQELQRVRQLSRLDFEQARDALQRTLADFSDAIGAGSNTFNTTYGRPANATRKRTPTPDDFEVVFALNAAIIEMSRLAAHQDVANELQIDPMDYVAGLAANAGVPFNRSQSKFPVPFPYGSTLEELALRYLGDANRWHEIATLNGLREPFVDEEGFLLPVLVNPRGKQVLVSDASNLYSGQPVWISSKVAAYTKRRILEIERYSAGVFSITVDGDQDLDGLLVSDGAQLQAFLPGTINSQMMVYIPSPQPAEEDPRLKSVPGVNDDDHLLDVGGIDLLLTPAGDLAITPDGDCRLAFGLTNIVQTARILVGTPRFSLLQHPDFGLGLQPGQSVAEVSAKELLDQAQASFRNHPLFSGVVGATIQREGPATRLGLELSIRGTNQTVPISFQVKT